MLSSVYQEPRIWGFTLFASYHLSWPHFHGCWRRHQTKTLLFIVQQAPWATCLHWFLLLPKSCRHNVEVGPGGGAHSVNLCHMWWALGLCNPRFYKGSCRKPYRTLALDGDTVSSFQVYLLYKHPWADILGQKLSQDI